ncbi:MAG: thiamine diphosphokinase [Deltaproteobacteria bacterium]|nr:thiamine diphosphokinase [Deltaproteobacteria bacterium]
MRAVIFANGYLNHPQDAARLIQPDDLLIAADGGARHCRNLGLIPDVVVGDMDSLGQDEVLELEELGAEIITYPREKDFTDLELAFLRAREADASEIIVLGGFGDRWDMTISNLLLAARSEFSGISVRMVEGSQETGLIRGSGEMCFEGKRGDVFSLIPLSREAVGVTLTGLEYPLREASLPVGSTMGISNVFTHDSATVSVKEGLLLCVITHKKSDWG